MVLPPPARGAGTLIPSAQRFARSGGGKGLRGSGAGTLGVPLGGTRRVGGLLGVAGRLSLSLPLGLALGSPIFPSGCEGKLGVALESLQGLRDLT